MRDHDRDKSGRAKIDGGKDATQLGIDNDMSGRDSQTLDQDGKTYGASKSEEDFSGLGGDLKTDKYKIKCKKDVSSSTDIIRERILIVDKTPSEIETGQRRKFPFITREEFERLQDEFLDVKETLQSASKPKDLQDQKLMEALSKATTSIDPMAALQFSATLETTEKKIDDLTNMFSLLAQQLPGAVDPNELDELMESITKAKQYRLAEGKGTMADLEQSKVEKGVKKGAKQYRSTDTKGTSTDKGGLEGTAKGTKKYRLIDGKDVTTATEQEQQTDTITKARMPSPTGAREAEEEQIEDVLQRVISIGKKSRSFATSIGGFPIKIREQVSDFIRESEGSQMPIKRSRVSYRSSTMFNQEQGAGSTVAIPTGYVTYEDMNSEMEIMRRTVMTELNTRKKHCVEQGDAVQKELKEYEQALKNTSKLKGPLENVNGLIANFAKGVNRIETNVSTAMSDYMEELTQMQYHLENHVEMMMEALASSLGDPVAVADFSKLLNFFSEKRQALHEQQIQASAEHNQLASDLEGLRALILALKMDKYDRSDFSESLANLVNMFDLNSLISYNTFEANWNKMDRKVVKAFASFDATEETWQEKITHTVQHLNCKANKMEIELIFNNIKMHCNNLDRQAKALSAIVDHGQAEADSRYLIRDVNCLSCRTLPAEYKRYTEHNAKGNKAETSKTATPRITGKENALGLKGVTHVRPCYPGELIKHALDPRAKFCPHYCGGDANTETLMKVQVQPLQPKCTCGDKMDKLKKPCIKCNTTCSGRMKHGQGWI